MPQSPALQHMLPSALTFYGQIPEDFVGLLGADLRVLFCILYPVSCIHARERIIMNNADLFDCRVDRVRDEMVVCSTGRDPCLFLEASPRLHSEDRPYRAMSFNGIYLSHLSIGVDCGW